MTALESLARHLCRAAGGKPDEMETVTLVRGDPCGTGLDRRDLRGSRPLWRKYQPRARDLLAFEEWRKAHVDLSST